MSFPLFILQMIVHYHQFFLRKKVVFCRKKHKRLMMDVHYLPCNVCVQVSSLRENIDRHSVTECIQSPPLLLCIDLNLVITCEAAAHLL